MRIKRPSTQPPTAPATMPMMPPKSAPTSTTAPPTVKEIRAPSLKRAKTSRPTLSVPIG